MRFFYSFGVGLLGASLLLQSAPAQTAPCPPVGIRTDPATAVNPGGQPNTFNWYYGNYQPTTYNGSRFMLNSPYPGVGQDYIELPWLQPTNPNVDRFQGKIDTPADGWELIRRDLGYDNAGNPSKTTNPTLILYNRVTGMLRVFTAVGDLQNGYQLAEIKLTFGATAGHKAGTLNRQSALGVALEDTEPGTNPGFIAIARYLNGRSKWFVADFPMDYDPCICQFDSRLQVDVNLISQADVKLVGQTSGSLVSATNGASTTSPEFDKGIPFIRKVNNALDAAGKSYDNMDKFTSKMSTLLPGKAASLKSMNDASKLGSFLKDGLGALPYVGAAVSMLDFFMGGGKDAGPQQVVMQPMTIEMSTTTTGTITSNSWATGIPFYNPGNRSSSSIPENVPYYNEAMGVFSLLTRPTVDVQLTTPYVGNSSLMKYSFRLTKDLQYVINPASKLEVQDFQAALIFEGPNNATPTKPNYDFGGIQTYEGTATSSTGTTSYLYRTDYTDALFIKNNIYAYTTPVPSNGYRGTGFYHSNVYLKIMLNLRRTDCSTCQNVLYVARYPVNINNVSSYASISAGSSGVLPQATVSTVSAICNGSKYTNAIALRQAKPAAHAPGEATAAPSLTAYPNPASGTVRFSVTTTEPGHVRVSLSDALGREVRQILDEDKGVAATVDISAHVEDLAPGIYYCVMQTSSGQRIVQKLVLVP